MMSLFFAADCAHVIVPEATEQAMRYYNSGNILWMVRQAWELLFPLLLLFTGLSGKLSGLSKKLGRNWFFTIVVFLVLYIAIDTLLSLPLDFYSSYVRGHEYGLSTQTLGRWFENFGKGTLVSVVFAIAFVWIFYLLLQKIKKWLSTTHFGQEDGSRNSLHKEWV